MGLQLPNRRPVRSAGQVPVEKALTQPDGNQKPRLEQVVAFLFAQRSWQTQSVLVTDQALFMGN